MWLIAIIGRWLPEGTFFVLSFPFVTLAGIALIFSRVYVSEKGICYLLAFPWKAVQVTVDEPNKLRLQMGSAWLGLAVDVPPKFQQRDKELTRNGNSNQDLPDEPSKPTD